MDVVESCDRQRLTVTYKDTIYKEQLSPFWEYKLNKQTEIDLR